MIDATEHMGLACYLAKKMYAKVKHKYELEELVQVAYVGLVEAANRFDESRGFKFATFAFHVITGKLMSFVIRDKRYNATKGIPHGYIIESYEHERDCGSLKDRIGNDGFEENLIEEIALKEAIDKLTEKEKEVLQLYYFDDIKQTEIAKLFNTTQTQISRVNRRAIKKLKIEMGVEKEKATKNPDKSVPSSIRSISTPLYHESRGVQVG